MNFLTVDVSIAEQVLLFIEKKTKLHNSTFRLMTVDAIRRGEYGKPRFSVLAEKAGLR